jgi:hypothetical protein
MLIKNVAVEIGLANGAVGTVVGFVYDASGNSKQKKKWIKPFATKVEFLETTKPFLLPIVLVQFDESFYCAQSWDTLKPRVVPICFDNFIFKLQDKTWTRYQLPLELAWCTTIHKTQGRTLNQLVLYTDSIHQAGQAYVGISRCRTIEGLKLIGKLQLTMFQPKNLNRQKQLNDEMARIRKMEIETLRFANQLQPCLNQIKSAPVNDSIIDQYLESEAASAEHRNLQMDTDNNQILEYDMSPINNESENVHESDRQENEERQIEYYDWREASQINNTQQIPQSEWFVATNEGTMDWYQMEELQDTEEDWKEEENPKNWNDPAND